MGFLDHHISDPTVDIKVRSAFEIWSKWVKILTDSAPPILLQAT